MQDLYQAIIPRPISALGCVSGWYPIHIWKRPCKGRHLYAVFVLICLACFMMCIFLCCMLFYCFNIAVSVFIFGKKLCRAYVIMLYTCRIKIKFSYLILCINLYISNPSLEKSTMIACINKNNEWPFPSRPLRLRPCHACSAKEQSKKMSNTDPPKNGLNQGAPKE